LPTAPITDPAAKEANATAIRLVQQLGSERFAERERATEQLIILGLPSIAHLERARQSKNREVRQRSQLILSVVHELDFQNRLRSFENDKQGDESYGLPGWERFRELVGNSAVSRTLFVEMQKNERELLSAETKASEEAGNMLERCGQRLRFSVQIFGTRHDLPPIAATLFVATNPSIPLHKSTHMSLMNLCAQSAFTNAIASKDHRSIMRNLLAAWILREDAVPANELMQKALEHNIDQSLPRARTLAKRAVDADLYDKHFAILCLTKFGGTDDLPTLEPLMADETVIARCRLNNLTYSVQMRDLVLAAMLTLTKNEPSEFGYGRLRLQEPYVFDTQSLGFAEDEDRQLAIAKWQLYRMRPQE